MKARARTGQSLDAKVIGRIHGGRGGKGVRGRGKVFTPGDFLDLGNRSAVDKVLTRAAKAGRIRKLARGLFDDPRLDATGQPLMPTNEAVIRAIAGRDAIRVQPSGAHAANLLGLTEQVPVRMVYLTDGQSRTITLGRRRIVLRHAPPRSMATAGRTSGTVIQALRWLGRRSVSDAILPRLRRQLTPGDLRQLGRDARFAPAWIAELMRKVARGGAP